MWASVRGALLALTRVAHPVDAVASFKAIELDRISRRPTGRAELLDGRGRDEAIAALLDRLGLSPAQARTDPTRTLVDLGASLWTIVRLNEAVAATEPPELRRAGAKHRRVR